jgi:hypothetical protein
VQLGDLKAEIEKMGLQSSWTLTAEAAEYRETLSINAQIGADAEARVRWLRQQSKVDPVTFDNESSDEEALQQSEV